MLADTPSSSQTFGHIAKESQIEAILYRSKNHRTKRCMALFPDNFFDSESFVQIQDDNPLEDNKKRLDGHTYKNFII